MWRSNQLHEIHRVHAKQAQVNLPVKKCQKLVAAEHQSREAQVDVVDALLDDGEWIFHVYQDRRR